VDGVLRSLDGEITLDKRKNHTIGGGRQTADQARRVEKRLKPRSRRLPLAGGLRWSR
jgi:hypothetical protein